MRVVIAVTAALLLLAAGLAGRMAILWAETQRFEASSVCLAGGGDGCRALHGGVVVGSRETAGRGSTRYVSVRLPDRRDAVYDATVFVDPPRLRTTLLAFIEAEVWWAREGPIAVNGGSVDGRLWFEVSRAGTELDGEAAQALFAPRRPGTGSGSKIGMFVSRGLARVMGGEAHARVERGSLILRFEVPLS